MKRLVEVKTMMFSLNEQESREQSPSSHYNNNSRMETIPSEHRLRGSKIFRKNTEAQTSRRLSHNPRNSPKSPLKGESPDQKPRKRKCLTLTRPRYDPLSELPQQLAPKSQSQLKIQPVLLVEKHPASPETAKDIKQTKFSSIWQPHPKIRIKSQPANSCTFKQQIMRRVSKKIQFMKKMTLDSQIVSPILVKGQKQTDRSKLFNFDRLYQHCLKKINRGINYYEKDLAKSKDRRYYQLKIQSSILSNQLQSMRRTIVKKKDSQDNHLGVIGNWIDLKEVQRMNTQRGISRSNTAGYRKKLNKICKTIEGRNPFIGTELLG